MTREIMDLNALTDSLRGRAVDIYEDPITCTKLEGRAKIVKVMCANDDGLMRVRVRFSDGDMVERLILTRSLI